MRMRTLVLGLTAALLVPGSLAAQQRGTRDLMATLRTAGNFNIFLQAVEGAGMGTQLRSGQVWTVFAPTDDAFGRIPGATRDSLLRDPALLEALIRNHVIQGRLSADETRAGGRGMSFLGGAAVKVDTSGSYTRVNGAQVIKGDMAASNGVIHVVDQVWLPQVRITVRGTNPVDSAQRASSPPRP